MAETYSVDHRGCQLSCSVRGDGAPVLFIQGVGVHGDGWLPQVEALTSKYQCLTFDNRGMGRSLPAGELSIELMAEDARVLMDAQKWESAHVVGHSMGGLIAQHLALAHPKRVRRYAFFQLIMPPDALINENLDMWAERLAPLFGHDLADQPPIAMKQLSAMGRYNATPRLKELALVPTLVVSAEHDRIAPPSCGKAIHAGIPGSRYVELTGVAHGVPLHRPELINELLIEHLGAAEKK